jgi:hypothetical protein
MTAKTSKIKNGSKVEYTEPYDDQLNMKYLVISDVVSDWVTLQPLNSTKSAFTANVGDLKLSK